MKKILLSLIVVFLASFVSNAQDIDPEFGPKENDSVTNKLSHYLVFDFGGGMHIHTYDMSGFGSKRPGLGFMTRAGYRLFFNNHWGIGTELNLKRYSTIATLDYVQEIDNAVDEEGEVYANRTYFNDLKEKQNQLTLNIPLGVYYQTQLSEKWKVVGGLGMFYQIKELSNKFKTTAGSLETRGYYSRFNGKDEELHSMPQHNFYTAADFKGDNAKLACLGIYGEGSMLYQLTQRLELDLGIYLSYGLNYQSESAGNLVYNPDCMDATAYKNAKYNGVLESSIVEKSQPLAIGLMAGVRYKLGRFGKDRKMPDDIDQNVINVPVDSTDNNVADTLTIEIVPDINNNDSLVVDNGNDDITGQGHDGDGNGVDNGGNKVDNGKNKTPGEILVEELKKFNKVSVNFAFNDATLKLTPAQKEMFDAVAKFMDEYPNLKLHIVGHTCNIGTLQQNMYVGQKRADATKKELMSRGVDSSRITTESKAYLDPLVPNTNEENRAKNRRIEFSVKDQK